MDAKSFIENSPGAIVAIHEGRIAFVPDPLPPRWEFPPTLWPLLAEAKQQIGILEGIGRTLPNPAILLRPLADRESLKSSSLEGTYVTSKELLLFELAPRTARSENDPANDRREVLNYRKALEHGTTSALPLSLRLLKELHGILLKGVRGRDRSPGEFRRVQVAIGRSEKFIPPPPERVMECLDPLERYWHAVPSPYDPLVDCFLIHYQFETIHPFVDGNGRVGRLLLAIMLLERCGLSKPWLYMSEFFERNRDEYFQRLFDVSTKADWSGWIAFCLRGTVEQAKDTIQRCERLRSLRDKFMEKLQDVGGSVRLGSIVDRMFYSPFIRVAEIQKEHGITYPTASADIQRLVKAGILQALPNVRPKTFYCPDVLNVAYDRLDES
jgi:Fic family protein